MWGGVAVNVFELVDVNPQKPFASSYALLNFISDVPAVGSLRPNENRCDGGVYEPPVNQSVYGGVTAPFRLLPQRGVKKAGGISTLDYMTRL